MFYSIKNWLETRGQNTKNETFIYYLSLNSSNMDNPEIDALFDQADILEAQKKERLQYLDSPRYANEKSFDNPFYVVVHADQIDVEMSAGNLQRDLGLKVNAEIEGLKSRHPDSWTKAGPHFLATGVPSDRPVLVCGAFEDVCVSQQYRRLLQAGYDAYISREGVLPLNSLN